MRVSLAYNRVLQADVKALIKEKTVLERENAALRAAIQRIHNEWVTLYKGEDGLDDAICAAIDAARKEAKP